MVELEKKPKKAKKSKKNKKSKSETAPVPAPAVPSGLEAELQALLASEQEQLESVGDDDAMQMLEAEHAAGRADGEISDFSDEEEDGVWAAGDESDSGGEDREAEGVSTKREPDDEAGSDASSARASSAVAAETGAGQDSAGSDPVQVPEGGKPGDWVCARCSAHCYASRTSCYKCSAPHPGGMAGLLKDSAAYLLSEGKAEPRKRGAKRAAAEPAASTGPKVYASGFAARTDQSCSIFINGLPYTATKQSIVAHFKDCCNVEDMAVRIVFDKATRRSKGVAFIDMPDTDAMNAACALHQSTFEAEDGSKRPINVRPAVAPSKLSEIAGRGSEKENEIKALVTEAVAKSRMRQDDCDAQVLNYLKVLPMEVVKQSIADFCELDANEGLDNVKNRSSFFMGLIKQRDAGFVNEDLTLPHFAEKAAKKAKYAEGTRSDDDGKVGNDEEARGDDETEEASKTVMIKGLPFSVTAADIAAHFESCCESGSSSDMAVRIVMDKATKQSKGIAFIDFKSSDECAKAVAMHQSEITAASDGAKRAINVRVASKVAPATGGNRGSKPGGRGGGGGRGRGRGGSRGGGRGGGRSRGEGSGRARGRGAWPKSGVMAGKGQSRGGKAVGR